VTIWTAVYPLTVLLNLMLAPLVGGWLLPLRALVTTLLLAPLMVYLGVPFVSKKVYPRWFARG
jgi:antibiotic biosynthesis monooxygenase (ABM) superfamily enzyme